MTLNAHRTAPSCCAWCGYKVDSATNITSGSKPRKGDMTLCLKCGEWNVFAAQWALRKPTAKEFMSIGANPGCRKLRWAWVELQKQLQKEKENPQ